MLCTVADAVAQQHPKDTTASAGNAWCNPAMVHATPQQRCPEPAAGMAWLVLGCVSMIQTPGWGREWDQQHSMQHGAPAAVAGFAGCCLPPTFACSQGYVARASSVAASCKQQAGQEPALGLRPGRQINSHERGALFPGIWKCMHGHTAAAAAAAAAAGPEVKMTRTPPAALVILGQLHALSSLIACYFCS